MPQHLPVTCNRDCIGGCPLLATVEEGRVTRIVDNPLAGPYMHGCIRGYQAMRQLYAPDRLTQPLLRVGPRGSGEFRPIPWPEALERVADGLSGIREQYGPQAILSLGSSGSCVGLLHNTGRLKARFLSLFGGCTATYSSYSTAAASFATPYVLGHAATGMDPATLAHSRLIVLWGANISDTRLGCEWQARIREAKERGTPVIVLDPRRTRTVRELGTQWIPVWPGTDAALMLAVLYVLIEEALLDRPFVDQHAHGFDLLERHVLGQDGTPPKNPAWAEGLCGTPAETIVAFARLYGQTHPAALIPGYSIQRTVGGEEAIRLAIALQTATGNLGRLGGSSGALPGNMPRPRISGIGVPTVKDMPSIPVYRWPDAILEGRAGGHPSDIHAVYNVGGNYLVEGADVRKNMHAFEQLEFAVCHELFLTPTARHCDVVLPVTHWLEREDIITANGNYLMFSQRAVAPLPQARNDYDIFCDLAERLGFGETFSEGKDEETWLREFVAHSEVPDYEEFRRTGLYMSADQERVGLADFVTDPQGHPLSTPSGRVEVASEAYARTGFPAIPQARLLPMREDYALRLVTPKSRYRTHSQFDNIPWFKEREPQRLWIHPQDAMARGIADGQQVTVRSPQGQVRIPAYVTEEIMPGVVCLLEGAWPCWETDGTDVAGSANVLTSTEPTQPSQGSRTHSVLVQVEG
jgi:anaerobic dimethyl sulfoxide reductase subunit A